MHSSSHRAVASGSAWAACRALIPAAVEAHDERPEVAARVVHLLRFLVATGEEGLVEGDGSLGVGVDELCELTGNAFEARDEVPAGPVRDEAGLDADEDPTGDAAELAEAGDPEGARELRPWAYGSVQPAP
jgi:hypothetical protein